MPPKNKKKDDSEDLGAMRAARFGRVKSASLPFHASVWSVVVVVVVAHICFHVDSLSFLIRRVSGN